MSLLADVAQQIMDLYYQQFKSDDDFFELSHFEYFGGVAYAKLLQDEYVNNYKLNLQVEGIGFVNLSQDWLKSEELEIQKDKYGEYFVKLKRQPFSFLFDQQSSGIQNVLPLGRNKCGEFIRMTTNDVWKLCSLPVTNKTFWHVVKDTIKFEKMKCKPESVQVLYVPGVDGEMEGFEVPKTKEADIIDWVMTRMLQAKNGNVVDMTNDGNPNKVMMNEINNIFSQIKTKANGQQ